MTRSRIASEPAILGGVPCIKGTRIPVATIKAMLADGMSVTEILESYPTLSAEDIATARKSAMSARLVFILFGIALLTLLTIFVALMSSPRPFDYTVIDTSARAALIQELEGDIVSFEGRLNDPASAHDDADLLWPYQRTRITLSVNQYIRDHGAPPNNLGVLFEKGYLARQETPGFFVLKNDGDRWGLWTTEGAHVASGN